MEIQFLGDPPSGLPVWRACQNDMRFRCEQLLGAGAPLLTLSFERRGQAYRVSIVGAPRDATQFLADRDAIQVAVTMVLARHGIPLISSGE